LKAMEELLKRCLKIFLFFVILPQISGLTPRNKILNLNLFWQFKFYF